MRRRSSRIRAHRISSLLLLLLLLHRQHRRSSSSSSLPSLPSASAEAADDAATKTRGIKCPIGFGRTTASSAEEEARTTIPDEWIDDGYCDCPTTGEDEPNTSACAGIEFWSGRTRTTAATADAGDGGGAASKQ